MNAPATSRSLLLILAVGVVAVLAVNQFAFQSTELGSVPQMRAATTLCATWFDAVAHFKQERQIKSDAHSLTKYHALLGNDYTATTTTLGSLDAKETAANPEFAALIVRLMLESGVDSSSTVGVILSGSFPSLGIATLAALQTIGAEAIVISSLGASSFGANQPEATWIDLESMLRQDVGLQYRSTIVTLGAENDKGEGIQAEGVALMEQAANRCGIALMRPSSLDESIRLKSELLLNAQIDLLVNIGGNEAAIGKCSDAAIIPNGLQPQWAGCLHSERGIIARIAEHHVPFIHLLNIKGLAARYGMPIGPGPSIPESTDLYVERTANPVGPVLGLLAVFGLLTGNRVKQNRTIRAENAREKEDFSENK